LTLEGNVVLRERRLIDLQMRKTKNTCQFDLE
jgi:hypothetical protein